MKNKFVATIIVPLLLLHITQISRSLPHRSSRVARMVRGRKADLDEWNFAVNLNFHHAKRKWKICGGALIDKQWVLTAAHCLEDIPNRPEYVSITVGRRKEAAKRAKNYKVKKIVMYAKYLVINALFNASTAEHFNWDYDIALLQLHKDVEYPARTVSLPTKKMLVSEMQGVKCRAAGWGSMKEYEREIDVIKQRYTPAEDLQEIDVPLISRAECRTVHKKEVTDLVFCGGQLKKNTMTSCIGDSGSPLICHVGSSNKPIVAGIVIGGNYFCRTGNEYMMFTDVARYRQWIDQHIK